MEPPDLWTTRIEPRFIERAPRLVRDDDGDRWYFEGRKFVGLSGAIQPGTRYEDQERLRSTGLWEEVRPGAYLPEEHVRDLDIDGMDAGLIYPTAGLLLFFFRTALCSPPSWALTMPGWPSSASPSPTASRASEWST